MVCPKMAGEVPRTGITLSRMFSTAPYFSGDACCSSESGRSSLTGFSTEKTVITSSGDTLNFFSFHLIFEANGSFTQSERVPILILVGSLLPPAPMEVRTRSPFLEQYASSSPLVFTSSMQSRT